MLLTITILGVKWYWILLVAGVSVGWYRYKFGDAVTSKTVKEMGSEEFNNYNEARFKTFKNLTNQENDLTGKMFDNPAKITIKDLKDADGEYFEITKVKPGTGFADIFVGLKPKKK